MDYLTCRKSLNQAEIIIKRQNENFIIVFFVGTVSNNSSRQNEFYFYNFPMNNNMAKLRVTIITLVIV